MVYVFVSSLDGVLFIDKTNHRDVDGSVSDRNFFGFESNLTSPSQRAHINIRVPSKFASSLES